VDIVILGYYIRVLPSIMPRLEEILKPQDLKLWTAYQEYELHGLKKEAKKSLDLFINSLKEYSEEQMDSIVLSLCEQRENSDLKIKHNLFEQIIYPNLVKNAKRNLTDYYRLLATFEQYFHSSNKLATDAHSELNLTENYISAIELLELELRNNQNTKAAKLLVNKFGWHLDYALHELPVGLLYEPPMIEDFCDRIERLINEYAVETAKWDLRLNFVRTVLSEWKAYIHEQVNSDFYEYLNAKGTASSTLILEWDKALLYDHQEI
jgi:hypothetical protein